jgi:Nucleotidyl transferase AbiEii toxin, Type IV TA system
MIPARTLTAWRATHPWPDDRQVEQDLILTRLAIEIGNHSDLRDRLIWRGGTCLHKLALQHPLRYSEDLDYVAHGVTGADFGTILSALRRIGESVGLEIGRTNAKTRKLDIRFRFSPASASVSANVKVEINVDEVAPLFPTQRRLLAIDTDWWRGSSDVLTFRSEELIGTKFRALAQRSKGRDLNDLELASRLLNLVDGDLAACAAHYLRNEQISSLQFKARLFEHLADPDFVEDIGRFITDPQLFFDPVQLVEKWIRWSDEHLDRALIDLDMRSGVKQAQERLADWNRRRSAGLVQCTTWVAEHGNTRRLRRGVPCRRPLPTARCGPQFLSWSAGSTSCRIG